MTPEEAQERVRAQNAELKALEDKVSTLAQTHMGQVVMAILKGLVEAICGKDGEVFRVSNKIRFYKGVLSILYGKGIS